MTTPTTHNDLLAQIGDALRGAQSVHLVTHIRPDGDAVGSLLGLALALQAAGKKVQAIINDGIPANLRQIPGAKEIIRQPEGSADLWVVLDCSDLNRTGLEWSPDNPPDINIDHHITNLNFARLNCVFPDAVATSAVLAEQLEYWGFPITRECAEALLTGIVSDSLGFRTNNTNPAALRLAADLMEKGADLPELYNRALMRRTFESARYWGEGLGKLQRDGKLIWTVLRLVDKIKVNYSGNDDADLVNFLSTIDDAEIAIMFVEQKDGAVKVSWRAQPGYDVSQLALQYGGGGHPGASGATLQGSIEQVQEQVLKSTSEYLRLSGRGNGK